MMNEDKSFLKIIGIVILVVLLILLALNLASGYQCNLNERCPVGDFILNDTVFVHTPVNLSGCNTTVYYSNGSILSHVQATNSSIGWHNNSALLTIADQYDVVMCCKFEGIRECYTYEVSTDDYCRPNENCHIRIFVFNDTDDYNMPINTLGCNLSLYYENNTALRSNQPMDNNSNGKQNYTFVFNSSGHYKAKICCDFDGDYMCQTQLIRIVDAPTTTTCEGAGGGGTPTPLARKLASEWSLSDTLWYFPFLSEYWSRELLISDERMGVLLTDCLDVRCTVFVNQTVLSYQPNFGILLLPYSELTARAQIEYENGDIEIVYVYIRVINLLFIVIVAVIVIVFMFLWWRKRRGKR